MSAISFGTDGIRGPAGQWPVDADVAARVGAAAVEVGGERVVVGCDTRPSSAALAAAVRAGVVRAGGWARGAGVVPTAALQLAIEAGHADVGVMVTASHNPASDNGFKVLVQRGRKPDPSQTLALEGAIGRGGVHRKGGRESEGSEPIVDAWIATLRAEASALSDRRFVVDLANGAASAHHARLAAMLPGWRWIGAGAGPINDRCGTEHLGALSREVQASGFDGGIAVDGDADRCRLVDERGGEVPGDALIWRLALDRSVSAVAVTVLSNGALEGALPGVRVVRTDVGDRHVRAAMDEQGIGLGGEESGHVLFADHAGGDGLLCGLRALSTVHRLGSSVSDGFGGFRPFPRRMEKVPAPVRRALDRLPSVVEAREHWGARLGSGGRIHLRFSGTEPVLRVLVEGPSRADVDAASAGLCDVLRAALS